MNEAGVVYVIQMNMSEPDDNPEWDNVEARGDHDQALAQIEWMKKEYGDQIEYRIDVVNFYPTN